jgi:hypothetical protein
MPSELVDSNVVIAAQQFNPTVFTQVWLLRNGILREDELECLKLFSPMAVNFDTGRFGLFVVPPQLVFAPKVPAANRQTLVEEVVGSIVRSLPHTPFAGVGLNFTLDVWPDHEDLGSVSRRLFSVPGNALFQAFEADDARLGACLSKAALDCRMTLDIKPINEGREKLRVFCNFHVDIGPNTENAVPEILQHLARWDDAMHETWAVIGLLNVQ